MKLLIDRLGKYRMKNGGIATITKISIDPLYNNQIIAYGGIGLFDRGKEWTLDGFHKCDKKSCDLRIIEKLEEK